MPDSSGRHVDPFAESLGPLDFAHNLVVEQSRSIGGGGRRPGVTALRAIIAFNLLSTAVHYTHNFLMAGMYPPVPVLFPTALSYRIGIAIFWPLLTGLGLWGYRLYRDGSTRRSRPLLVAYSMLGFTTLGHFLGGSPDIPPFFYATLFTDFLAGSSLLLFVAWTFRSEQQS